MRVPIRFAAASIALGVVAVGSSRAHAESIIKDPNPPKYSVEIEPHLNLQYLFFEQYKANGFGPGVRFGIPLMSPGFIKSINDSIALSLGGDLMYLRPTEKAKDCGPEGCEYKAFWGLYFPITMQWNFWLTDKLSVFGEPGGVIQTAATECERIYGCKKPSWIGPAFYAGARYHFSDSMALTMRVGWPNGLSVGCPSSDRLS